VEPGAATGVVAAESDDNRMPRFIQNSNVADRMIGSNAAADEQQRMQAHDETGDRVPMHNVSF
jgi:hypothetical protein